MPLSLDLARSLINVLDEPALIVEGSRTLAANAAARDLLGHGIEGTDIRFAIRHPEALQTILAGNAAELELVGIGSADRPWLMHLRAIGNGMRSPGRSLGWPSGRENARRFRRERQP